MVMKYIISEKQLKFITEQGSNQKNNILLMYAKIKWEENDAALADTNGEVIATYPDDTNYIVFVVNNKDVYFSRDVTNDKLKKLNPQDIEFVSEYRHGNDGLTWIIDTINEKLDKGEVIEAKKFKAKGKLFNGVFKRKLLLPPNVTKETHPHLFKTKYTPEGHPIPRKAGGSLYNYVLFDDKKKIVLFKPNMDNNFTLFKSLEGEYYIVRDQDYLYHINKYIIEDVTLNQRDYEKLNIVIDMYNDNKIKETSISFINDNYDLIFTIT